MGKGWDGGGGGEVGGVGGGGVGWRRGGGEVGWRRRGKGGMEEVGEGKIKRGKGTPVQRLRNPHQCM